MSRSSRGSREEVAEYTAVCSIANRFPVLQGNRLVLFGGLSAQRVFSKDQSASAFSTVNNYLSPEFITFHTTRNQYGDNKSHVVIGDELECDYFAHICFQAVNRHERHTAEAQQKAVEKAATGEELYHALLAKSAVKPAKADSPPRNDIRGVAMFEIGSSPNDAFYKLSQMEIRLAFRRAYCAAAKKKDPQPVATARTNDNQPFTSETPPKDGSLLLCGIFVHPKMVQYVQQFLTNSPTLFVNCTKFNCIVHSTCTAVDDGVSSDGMLIGDIKSRANALPSSAPNAMWVRLQEADDTFNAAFRVFPASNDIDGLKDAIKVKMGTDYTGNAARFRIFKFDATTQQWAEVTQPDETLEANTAQTPYGFMLP